ncbi:hypothetical protein MRS76_05030 [Rhizobiaceae bacterium n13]|uniref:Uncharacterized protein n=1 Tax=Ferirhizobium litorale TaxID=2927786 RepID=A0AAE3TZX1_9HYPH|nr:hypothetical protein [Fererhizobium litorale]MDI7861312.1 hypothetical protein [Fererhizobium litorale]MDI7921459.1 hypothetical protein [Fererhizobium litorale]
MKIGDSHNDYYRIRIGNSATGTGLPAGSDIGGPRSQAPTVSIGGTASASSLSSTLWLSLADRLESGTVTEPLKSSAADEFMEWAEMSLAEKIRAQILADKDMTEDDLAAMDADQRAAIEKEIEEAIKRQMGVEEAKATEQGEAASGATA